MAKQKWKDYEEVATDLLNQFKKEFGLERVEGKQKVEGKRSGAMWEIDAKGVIDDNGGFMIVECRRHTKAKQSQEKVGGLAFRILDTEAEGGIVVSPLGLQEGAEKVAKSENIINVTLTPESTPNDFDMGFFGKFRAARSLSANICGVKPNSGEDSV